MQTARDQEIVGWIARIGAASYQIHLCAADQRKVYCWGDNEYGQLGDGTRENGLTPVAVTGIG